jgi:hypothetical protein
MAAEHDPQTWRYAEIPPGFRPTASAVPLNTYHAFQEHLQDQRLNPAASWQDAASSIASAVWARAPEAVQLQEADPTESEDYKATTIDLALRMGAIVGYALARTYPERLEDLGDWARRACAYADLEVCELSIIPDGGDSPA